VWHLRISNRALRIVLGSTADWWDVAAYVIGFAAVLALESLRNAFKAFKAFKAIRAVRPKTSAP
jgi:hypothetical protein